MNIRHSKHVLTLLLSTIALGSASFAGAAESGLSHNEQAAQRAIFDAASTSIATAHDARIATLAQNESAAQRVIVVDYGAISSPIVVGGETAALVGNERAAQRAIVDAPRANRPVATTPVAAR